MSLGSEGELAVRKGFIALILLATFLINLIPSNAQPNKWIDPLEVPSMPDLDVKYLSITGSNGNYTVRIGFYEGVPKKFIVNIYVDDLKKGTGVENGELKGADLLISTLPPNLCSAMPYDPLSKGFSRTTMIRCRSSVENEEIVVRLPNLKAMGFPDKFGIKAFIWSAVQDNLGSGIYTISSTKVKPKIDGIFREWSIPPLIVDKVGDAPKGADFKEFYGVVKENSLFFSVLPADELLCNIKGEGADIEWYLRVMIDADVNPKTGLINGTETGAEFLYTCGWNGRTWTYVAGYPEYYFYLRHKLSAAINSLEGRIILNPVWGIVSRSKKLEVFASVLTRIKDKVPDKGWLIVGQEGIKLSDFTLSGPKVDLDMSSDLLKEFKSVGQTGANSVVLGGPNVNPNFKSSASFLKSSRGLYSGIEVNGRKFWATYGKVDFSVVQVNKTASGYLISVAGITRYGTRAGLLWLVENQSFIREGTYVLSWIDDGDGEVEISEIGEVLAP